MLKARLAELDAQGLEGDELARRERELDDSTMYVLFSLLHFFLLFLLCDFFRLPYFSWIKDWLYVFGDKIKTNQWPFLLRHLFFLL